MFMMANTALPKIPESPAGSDTAWRNPHNIRALEDIDDPGDQAGGNKRRDQRNKDVCQLSQRIAHGGFVFGLCLRFGALSIVNRRARAHAHQRAHGIHNLRRFPGPTIS
jgi:hypothetical protein